MIKAKNNHFFKRLMAFILVLITLSSALSVTAFAGDSVFMETLLNTDKYTYVANLTSDTKAKSKKYAYKYMNLAYVVGKGCQIYDGEKLAGSDALDNPESQKNPNYCFRLEERYEYTKINYRSNKSTEGADAINTANAKNGYGRALDLFLLLEGYLQKGMTNVMITDDSNISSAASVTHKYISKTKVKNTTSPLSYPGYYTETVTTEQSEYAQETVNLLTSSLNGILTEVNDGNKFKSVSELVNKSILIRPDDLNNVTVIYPHDEGYRGYVIVYSDLTSVKPGLEYETSTGQANRILSGYRINDGKYSIPGNSSDFLNALNLPRANAEKQLYAYVFPIDEDRSSILVNDGSVFIYAIPKGFTTITGQYDPDFLPSGANTAFTMTTPEFTEKGKQYDYTSAQKDVPWVNIHMLSMYANTVYKHHNISVTTYIEPDTNLFSKLIAGIFSAILSVIRSVLGLADIDVLVFNLGVRGSAAYNFGLMSENWWNVVLQYQLIFQAIAWVILVCGFIKTLIDLNLSTINPQKRMSVYETIQKFIVVGIGLVILIPAVQFLLECNNVLVELFASQIETSALNMPSVNNALVQFLVGMMWITILLYINFIYIMRSITIALLIASGPFFISTIAFSHGGKSALFTSWAKELLANIFVQSVHAFILSFLMQLLSSGTFLETFAIAISIIPLTEMFRNLIFAGAGGSTSQMANTAAGAMNRMGTAIGKGVVSAGGAAIGGIFGKDEGGDGEKGGGGKGKDGEGKGSTTGSLISNAAQKKLGKMGDGTSHGSKIAKSLANKSGKEKPNFGMKALGGTVDGLEIAGMMMGAGVAEIAANMPDLQQGMADLALKGDYQGLGKAMDKVTTAQGKQLGGVAAGGVKAAMKKNDVQKASSAVQTNNAAQMGQSTVDAESGAKGQTTGGATMQTPKLTGEKTIYEKTDSKIQDVTNVGDAKQAQIMAGFNAGTNQKVEDSVVATKDGKGGRVGKTYSYTDSNGNKQSFFVQGEGVSDSVQAQATSATPATPSTSFGGETVRQTKKTTAAAAQTSEQQAGAAMAMKHGTNVNSDYLNEHGNAIGHDAVIKDANGNLTYVDQNTRAKANDIIQDYQKAQLATNNGIVYGQDTSSYSNAVAGAYNKHKNQSTGIIDMTKAQLGAESDAAYTDAAMIASIGDNAGMADGVYKIGGHTFNTGLSKQQATQILASRGINGVQSNGSNMSYHQHNPNPTNNGFVAARQGSNGHPIAQYATGIGKQGGPTWQADGSGGGTMKFSDQHAAVTYFQTQGNTSMANEIANMSANKTYTRGAQTFSNTSEGFSLSFDGSKLKKQGVQMEIASNGSDMYVSSFDGQVKDPFALDNSPVTPPEENKRSKGDLTAETIEKNVPNGNTPTTN